MTGLFYIFLYFLSSSSYLILHTQCRRYKHYTHISSKKVKSGGSRQLPHHSDPLKKKRENLHNKNLCLSLDSLYDYLVHSTRLYSILSIIHYRPWIENKRKKEREREKKEKQCSITQIVFRIFPSHSIYSFGHLIIQSFSLSAF